MAKLPQPADPPRRNNGGKDKDPELVAFGRRLCRLRKAAGMTQEGLAHAAGLHWTYVGQIERGERNLTYKNVLKLARGLGLEPNRLMSNGD
ncbi:MAG: helix-turn-helix transcriptional regulator [Solirubrobacterales bacterium]